MRRSDPVLILMLILTGVLGVLLGIFAPLVYLWIVGLAACVGILILMVTVVGNMPLWWAIFFGREFIEACFGIIGAILKVLICASASSGSSSSD